MESPKYINTTLENHIPVDPERSTLPLTLVGDRVIIEPIQPDKYLSMEANIVKSLEAKEPFLKGKIMNLGGGEYGVEIPKSFKPGMIVNYWHQQAIDFVVEKKTYHLVRSGDIFGIL